MNASIANNVYIVKYIEFYLSFMESAVCIYCFVLVKHYSITFLIEDWDWDWDFDKRDNIKVI